MITQEDKSEFVKTLKVKGKPVQITVNELDEILRRFEKIYHKQGAGIIEDGLQLMSIFSPKESSIARVYFNELEGAGLEEEIQDDEEELIAEAKRTIYKNTQAAMADLHAIFDVLVKQGGNPTMGQGVEILRSQDQHKAALVEVEIERAYTEACEEEVIPHDTCIWTCEEEEEPQVYRTECGDAFFLHDGTIEDEGFKYCPYCGGEINEAHKVEPGPGDVNREGETMQ